MNDMRMVKYETLIEEIDSSLKKTIFRFGEREYKMKSEYYISGNKALELIYDYEKCNDYAKIILNNYTLVFWIKDERVEGDEWVEDMFFRNEREKFESAKRFIQLCRKEEHNGEGYKFIFWALMILTVDKTDAEEHLALICDFAKMLRITKDEFKDIIEFVKRVYCYSDDNYTFASDKTQTVFEPLYHRLRESFL